MNTNTPDDGGPAFPNEGGEASGLYSHPGMTLRDWFAGNAMQGILSAENKPYSPNERRDIAGLSYRIADAMLKAREVKQ